MNTSFVDVYHLLVCMIHTQTSVKTKRQGSKSSKSKSSTTSSSSSSSSNATSSSSNPSATPRPVVGGKSPRVTTDALAEKAKREVCVMFSYVCV
jgi:hypothetical protein